MASIVTKKRKSGTTYYIVQRYTDEDTGRMKQHWIPCRDRQEARLLLDDVREAEKVGRRYEPEAHYCRYDKVPTVKTVVGQYIETRCSAWEPSTLRIARITSEYYIYPYIGNVPVDELTPQRIQHYYMDLPNHNVAPGNHTKSSKKISARGVKEVHKILRPAMDMAVTWGWIKFNPALSVQLPRQNRYRRKQWSEEEVVYALSICDDPLLHLAIGLQYTGTCRTGELSALTWDCVHTAESDMSSGNARIALHKTLRRVYRDDLASTRAENFFEFPAESKDTKTVLVLKRQKTESSRREVFLPVSMADELNRYRKRQQRIKSALGEGYHDYNLVLCQDNGNPIESKYLAKRFRNFCNSAGLTPVDFYSLRHSGATTKLSHTHDIKAVQGDMGHSSPDMLTKVYAAIREDSRRNIAAVMERQVFAKGDIVVDE